MAVPAPGTNCCSLCCARFSISQEQARRMMLTLSAPPLCPKTAVAGCLRGALKARWLELTPSPSLRFIWPCRAESLAKSEAQDNEMSDCPSNHRTAATTAQTDHVGSDTDQRHAWLRWRRSRACRCCCTTASCSSSDSHSLYVPLDRPNLSLDGVTGDR
jgi:hypothetical protein